MTTPQELDRLIDDHLNGNPTPPDSQESTLTAELLTLANRFSLDSEFDSALGSQFKTPAIIPLPARRRFSWQKLVAAVATILFGLVVMTLSVPQFRAFAQDIIDDLFPRDTSNERTITFENFDEDVEQFDTVESMQEAVAFEIVSPELGSDYVLRLAVVVHSRNSTLLRFTPPDEDFPTYQFSQQPLADAIEGVFWLSTEDNTIGANAAVVDVQIGDYAGEFVRGEWVTRDQSDSAEKEYLWSNNVPIFRLRWQDETFLYEIKLVSTEAVEPGQLVAIAESMMGLPHN